MSVYIISFYFILCLFVSSNTKINNLYTSSQKQQVQKCWQCHANKESFVEEILKINLTVTSREIYFWSLSNNTPSIPPYCVGSGRKAVSGEIYNE